MMTLNFIMFRVMNRLPLLLLLLKLEVYHRGRYLNDTTVNFCKPRGPLLKFDLLRVVHGLLLKFDLLTVVHGLLLKFDLLTVVHGLLLKFD